MCNRERGETMRRSILLVLSVALAVLVFAPVAAAQGDDRGSDDRGMDDRGMDDRGFDDRGLDDRGADDRGVDDNVAPTPASSASASTSAMSGASASASPTSSASATSSAGGAASSAMRVLPDTGGIPLIPLLSVTVLALLIGTGVVTTMLVRRSS